MNYAQVEAFLFSSLPMFQRIGAAAYKADLTNTLAFCAHLNQPQQQFPSIHIAGTNGKGSVSHSLASVFMSAGYKTGLFTSPHLLSFTERIKINGQEIDKQAVVEFVLQNKAFIELHAPSFFEMTAAMAFWYFAQQKVDIAIVETGMGGRLDSTNVLNPLLSVITNIGLDHTEFLGPDLPSIAAEKAGIIKPNTPVLIGLRQPETQPVFQQKSMEEKAILFFSDELLSWTAESHSIGSWNLKPAPKKMHLACTEIHFPLGGWYQKENAATAFAALQVFSHTYPHWRLDATAIEAGFRNMVKQTGLRGRWEILRHSPLVIADTAHNPPGWKGAMEQLSHTAAGKPIHMVFGLVQGKDATAMLNMIPLGTQLYLACPDVPRGMPVAELARVIPKNFKINLVANSVAEAFAAALNQAGNTGVVYVGGSTFVVADIMKKMFS
jgi:dihydrofolate synthase/folylpolyglutamate synthase